MADQFIDFQLRVAVPSTANLSAVQRQIQSKLSNIKVDFALNGGKQAQRDLVGIANASQKAEKDTISFGEAIGIAGKNFVAYSSAVAVVGRLAIAMSRATRDAIKFEREFIKLAQVFNVNVKSLGKLQGAISELSKEYGLSANVIAKTSVILAQSGLTARETEAALRALTKTTLASTFGNIAATTEAAVAIIAQFEQGAKSLERQLGSVNAVSKTFAVESQDIAEAVTRAGGAFKSAGGNFEEFIALFTAVRSTTRETAETISTGFRTIFARLQRAKTIKFFKNLNIELQTAEGQFVGPLQAIRNLTEGLDRLGIQAGSIKFAQVVEQLGGIRQVSRVIPLLQQRTKIEKALQVARAGGASLDKDVAKAQETLAQSLARTTENFSALVREISQTESFQAIANIALSMANSFIETTRAIKPLIPLLALLGTFKLTGIIGTALKTGFSPRVAGTRRPIGRNAGGIVPGSGNSDTVPAMLTPGEFVIRKSAVQAFGQDGLADINRYKRGGNVTTRKLLTAAGDIQGQKTVRKNVANTDNWQGQDNLYLNYKIKEINPLTTKNVRDKNSYIRGKKTGNATKAGNAFERIVGRRIGKRPTPNNNFLDFPNGEAKSDKNFGKVLTGNRYLSILAKTLNERTAYRNEFTEGKDTVSPQKRDITVYVDSQRNLKHKLPSVRKLAAGGGVGTDTVPALLTPGEFVINKKSADAFGRGGLQKINKMAKGGPVGVQKFANGGNVKELMSPTRGFEARLVELNTQLAKLNKQSSKLGSGRGLDPREYSKRQKELSDATSQVKREMVEINKATQAFEDSLNAASKATRGFQSGKSSRRVSGTGKVLNPPDEGIALPPTPTVQRRGVTNAQKLATSQATVSTVKASKAAAQSVQQSTVAYNKSGKGSFPINTGTSSKQSASTQRQTAAVSKQTAAVSANIQATNESTKASEGSSISAFLAIGAIESLSTAMIDQESGLARVLNKLFSFVNIIVATELALSAFGLSLKTQAVGNFFKDKIPFKGLAKNLTGKVKKVSSGLTGGFKLGKSSAIGQGAFGRSTARQAATQAGGLTSKAFNLGSKIAPVIKSLAPFAKVLSLGTIGMTVFTSVLDAGRGIEEAKQKAIEKGNAAEAEAATRTTEAASAANTLAVSLTAGGAAAGAFFGPLGAAIGAGVGAVLGFATKIGEYSGLIDENSLIGFQDGLSSLSGGLIQSGSAAIEHAQLLAGVNKSLLELEKVGEKSESAVKDFKAGLIKSKDLITQTEAGGTIGAASRRLKEGQEQLKPSAIRSFFTSGILGNITTGAIDKSAGTKLGSEEQEKLKASIQGALQDLEPVFDILQKEVIDSGGSLEDFKDKLESQLSPTAFDSLDFTAIEEKFERLKSVYDNEIKARQAENQERARIFQIEQAFIQKQVRSQAVVQNSLNNLSLALLNTSKDFNALPSLTNLFNRQTVAPGDQLKDLSNVVDRQGFNKALQQAVALGFSQSEVRDVSRAASASRAIRSPGGVVEQVAISASRERLASTSQSKDDLKAAAEDTFNDPAGLQGFLSGIGTDPVTTAAIKEGFETLFVNSENGIDPKALQNLLEKHLVEPSQKVSNKLVEGLNAQREALKLFGQGLSQYNDLVKERNNREIDFIKNTLEARNKAFDKEQELKTFRGQKTTRQDIKNRNVAGGIPAVGGVGLANAARNAQQRFERFRRSLEDTGITTKLQTTVLNNLDLAAKKAKTTLEAYGKSLEDQASIVKDQIQSEKSLTDARRSFSSQFTFGSNEDRQKQLQNIKATQFAANQGSIQNVPEQFRSGIESILDQFADSPIFGGKTGSEVKGDLLADTLLRQGLINQQEAAELRKGVSSKEDKLINELGGIFKEQAQIDAINLQSERDSINLFAGHVIKFGAQVDALAAKFNIAAPVQPGNTVINPLGSATGGMIYASEGQLVNFQPQGTDTVPAMLTPGEFVVKKSSVNKYGSGMMEAINAGNYYAGGKVTAEDEKIVGRPAPVFTKNLKEFLKTNLTKAQASGVTQAFESRGIKPEKITNPKRFQANEGQYILNKTVPYENIGLKNASFPKNITVLTPEERMFFTWAKKSGITDLGEARRKVNIDFFKRNQQLINQNFGKKEFQSKPPTKENPSTSVLKKLGFFNDGGPVGGVPGIDANPAMLTRGEYVINKKSAEAIGTNNLNKLNSPKGYAKGGRVGYFYDGGVAHGNGSSGGEMDFFSPFSNSVDKLIGSNGFTMFKDSIDKFEAIPKELTLTVAPLNVSVNLNGAELLSVLSNDVQRNIMSEVRNEIDNIVVRLKNGDIV